MTTTLEHRARAMDRLAEGTRVKLGRAFHLAHRALRDEASDLLVLADDTGDWAEDLGPDAEAWAERVVKLTGITMRLMDSAKVSLDLALAQLETLTDEINNHA